MHLIAAMLLVLHGVAHLVGFRAAFWPAYAPPVAQRPHPYRKIDGLMWLGLSLAFVGTAALLIARQESWTTLLLLSSSGSLVMCVLAWPEARIGLVIDVVLLVLALLLTPRSTGSRVITAFELDGASSSPSELSTFTARPNVSGK
jgi:hypothetical protein